MNISRRHLLGATVGLSIPVISGCVEGELVDTTYDCDIDEPNLTPKEGQPTLGDTDGDVSISIYHDYTDPPSQTFIRDVFHDIQDEYLDRDEVEIVLYDVHVPGDETWAHQLTSVGRFLFNEHGAEAYLEYLLEIHEHFPDPTWQAVGDIADDIGADPCTTIANGSWKTYEEIVEDERSEILEDGIGEVPAVIINGDRITRMTPIEASYDPIKDKIEQNLEANNR